VVEDHTSNNPQPESTRGGASRPRKRKGGWGGRRPGAGAPKGNLNALKHGRFSRYQKALIEALLQVPETREVMTALAKRQQAQRRLAEQGGAALMSELLRRTGQVALQGDDHLEDIQEFLAAIRTAEAQLEKILESNQVQRRENAPQSSAPTPAIPASEARKVANALHEGRGFW
jgi:hypothetical protein